MQWIAMYFHAPAVSTQLLLVVDGRRWSFVVGCVVLRAMRIVRGVPVHVVQISDGVVVVAVTGPIIVRVMTDLHPVHSPSTACELALDRLPVSSILRVFPRKPRLTAVVAIISVTRSSLIVLSTRR